MAGHSFEPAQAARSSSRVTEVFVGRERELDELRVLMDQALAGYGGIAMLVGEPGIGKTHTVQQLASYARERGVQVLWGWCHEEEGAPPYWPWVEPIRSYIQQKQSEELRSEVGPDACFLAEFISDLRHKLPDVPPPPSLEPQEARFHLFDAFTTFLKNAAQWRPMIVVLDDLHWADQPSLLLLQFLARRISETHILVVGCYRDMEVSRRHPLTEALAELTREQRFRRVPLHGLSREEVASFVQTVRGSVPSSGLVDAIHQRTEGNPLFVAEIVRLLLQEEGLSGGWSGQAESWSLRIPDGVREVIGRRLNRLSQDSNQVLRTASLFGRGFTLEQLRGLLIQYSEPNLLETIDEALLARVIEELPPRAGYYQFTHRLVQETLAEEMSLTRRARLHAQIAEMLEDLYGDESEAHAAELAYHFAQAEAISGSSKLVHYSLLAGERALNAYAWEEAVVYFQRALAAQERRPTDSQTAALLFGLGRAKEATLVRYQFQEYIPKLRQAFDYYAETGDIARAVGVAEYPVRLAPGVDAGWASVVRRALSMVPGESHEAGRLLATMGLVLYQETANYGEAQEALRRSLAIARRDQDSPLELRALANAVNVDFHHALWEEVLEKGQQVIELSRRADALPAEAAARFDIARALDYMGHCAEAEEQAEIMLAQAERLRGRGLLGCALYVKGVLAFHRGAWAAARDLYERSVALTPGYPSVLCARAVLEFQPGDFDAGRAHLQRLLEVTRLPRMGAGYA